MDDLEFIRQIIKGENQAREQLLKRYTPLIYKYIYHVLGVKGFKDPDSHAKDIFQSFIVFLIDDDYKKLKSFQARNGATLATWIRYLTINFARDYLRRVKFHISLDVETEEGVVPKDVIVDNSLSALEALSVQEKSEALVGCIDLLNKEDKYFLELNFNQKVSLEIMRDFFKLTRGAIDMQKVRLMKKLKDCFKHKGFELDF